MMYTRKELAALFNASIRTIDNWIKSGKLESIKIGGVVRVTEPALQKFLEDAKNEK